MELYPLTFEPILKERIWGGRKLEQLYAKKLPGQSPIGESWELSDRPEDISVVASGPLAGKDLHWLIETFGPQLTGNARLHKGRFPLLIKILDAREKLSLQVHPPAAKAAELGGEPKTEMWYIAEAEAGAELYVGLKRGCTRKDFAKRIQTGTVEDCFHRVPVRRGDAIFLPSGRVHALGAGLVIFEIQQNSDTTYRVFDWNRLGLDGKARELHIRQSLESIDFKDFEPGLIRPQESQRATLVSDPLFTVELATMGTGERLNFGPGKMQILGVVSGEALVEGSGMGLALRTGQFCLIPASVAATVQPGRNGTKLLRVEAGEGSGA